LLVRENDMAGWSFHSTKKPRGKSQVFSVNTQASGDQTSAWTALATG
jgi:hypothetical protein